MHFRIETPRLVLRPWRPEDREHAYAMARDDEVMRYLPAQSREDSDAMIERIHASQEAHGHCFWVVEERATHRFLGYCGIVAPRPPLAEYEIGWRLARSAWKLGYATEAARATLEWTWANLITDSVVAITVPANRASQRVMERIGMARHADEDFAHPALAEDDPLRPHVLYRIRRPI